MRYSSRSRARYFVFFFFNDTATTEIYTLSLHDALPISGPAHPRLWTGRHRLVRPVGRGDDRGGMGVRPGAGHRHRSEEHTSELQSRQYLVCRLLLEKKKNSCKTRRLILRIPRRTPTYIR